MTRQPFLPRETVISNLAKIGFKDITNKGWFDLSGPGFAYFENLAEEVDECLAVCFNENRFFLNSNRYGKTITEKSSYLFDSWLITIHNALYGAIEEA